MILQNFVINIKIPDFNENFLDFTWLY